LRLEVAFELLKQQALFYFKSENIQPFDFSEIWIRYFAFIEILSHVKFQGEISNGAQMAKVSRFRIFSGKKLAVFLNYP
jgi:hypothetical protein